MSTNSLLTLKDSADGQIQSLVVYGKSTQKTYQGYNLIDLDSAEFGGINYSSGAEPELSTVLSRVRIAKKPLPSGISTIYVKNNVKDTRIGVHLYDSNYYGLYDTGWKAYGTTITIPIANYSGATYYGIVVSNWSESTDEEWQSHSFTDLDSAKDTLGQMTVVQNTTTVLDEPYVGAIQSPNPKYPQEIESVNLSGIETRNKNFIVNNWQSYSDSNFNTLYRNAFSWLDITDHLDEKITVSFDCDTSITGYENFYSVGLGTFQHYLSDWLWKTNSDGKRHNSLTNRIPSEESYIKTNIEKGWVYVAVRPERWQQVVQGEISYSHLQVELSDHETEYQDPQSSSVTVSNIDPLRAVGDYKDRLILNADGSGYIERNVGIQTIETVTVSAYANKAYTNLTYCEVAKATNNAGYNEYDSYTSICDRASFVYYDPLIGWNKSEFINTFNSNASRLMYWFGIPRDMTSEEATELYKGAKIYYPLKTPVIETLTSDQLSGFLKSYYPTTHIIAKTNMKTDIQVQYPADFKNHVDKVFDDLEDTVASV